jgi:hypothetical protein
VGQHRVRQPTAGGRAKAKSRPANEAATHRWWTAPKSTDESRRALQVQVMGETFSKSGRTIQGRRKPLKASSSTRGMASTAPAIRATIQPA